MRIPADNCRPFQCKHCQNVACFEGLWPRVDSASIHVTSRAARFRIAASLEAGKRGTALQAMTPAWEEHWLKCTMSHDTTPLAISDTLEASTGPGRSSCSRRKGCTPLLQPWCGSRNRRGTSPRHWQSEFGTCLAMSAGITSSQLFVDSRTARTATRPGLVVAAFCSFCSSPCAAQRFHQVANDSFGSWSCRVDVWTSVFV